MTVFSLVPPEFDNEALKSGTVITVREYENVTLTCRANGNPKVNKPFPRRSAN